MATKDLLTLADLDAETRKDLITSKLKRDAGLPDSDDDSGTVELNPNAKTIAAERDADESGLELGEAAEGEDYGSIDDALLMRPFVLHERDVKNHKANLDDAERAHNVAFLRFDNVGKGSFTSSDARAIAIRDASPSLEKADSDLLDAVGPILENLRQIARATEQPREESLSDDDFQRANLRRAFVQEDAEKLPIPKLLRKLENAMATKDTASLWLYLRYGSQRLQNLSDADRRQVQAAETLRTVLRSVNDRFLNKDGLPIAEKARELMERAKQLQQRVNSRRLAQVKAGSRAVESRYSNVM